MASRMDEDEHSSQKTHDTNKRDRSRQELHLPVRDLASPPEGQWPELRKHKVNATLAIRRLKRIRRDAV
jgi:hypothetical protein